MVTGMGSGIRGKGMGKEGKCRKIEVVKEREGNKQWLS